MPTFEELNRKTEFLVEAEYVNLFARAKTYYDKHFPSKLRSENWKNSGTGMIYRVGEIDDRLIMVTITHVIIDGAVIGLYHSDSQLVDWKMIESYLDEKYPNIKRANLDNIYKMYIHINEREEVQVKKRSRV